MNISTDQARASVSKITQQILQTSSSAFSELGTPGIPPKDAEKVLLSFCHDAIETMSSELPNIRTIEILRDWIMHLAGMSERSIDTTTGHFNRDHSHGTGLNLSRQSLDLSYLSISSSGKIE